jgi:pyruvate dehydrogenase E2 component (dihydrolipoamide acetyltransferase)
VADFKVPELGENVVGGDVTRVLVKVGDTIARDQPVLELETDKATIEVPSSVAGRVTDIKVKQGDKINVGAVILTVEDGGAGAKSQTPTSKSQAATESELQEFRGPASTGSRGAVNAAEGQTPEPKTQSQRSKGQSAKPKADSEKVVSMPTRTAPEAAKASRGETPESGRPMAPEYAPRGSAAPAAPSVRRLAREVGVDIDEVQGSGPEGRISEDDVKEHARRILSSIGASATGAGASRGSAERALPPLPDFERWGEVERQPMTKIRQITADRLGYAWNVIPHVTQFDKADITAMEELRKKYREQVQRAGGNLTVTAMLVKVIATAVKQFPQFNASLDPRSNEIVYKRYVNVGVAVDTDRGLLVPVVRDADQKNITEIAIDVHQTAEKARNKKITIEEMSGGTITISNLGGLGGTYFTPIVNWPEVAILGVSRGIVEPVWRPTSGSPSSGQGAFEPRQLLPLSLSYDHRVIDGADAMRFLRWVVDAIEQPFLLSLLS